MKIIIANDYEQMSLEAANIITDIIKSNPKAVLGLATGSSPIGLYENLIKEYKSGNISFKDIKTINLDEYIGLDGDHPKSYRYFMDDVLFNHVDIDKSNTFIPNGKAQNLEEECTSYERKLDELGGQDVQILGIGTNGHIGFNEPSEELVLYTHVENLQDSTIQANSRFFKSIEEVPTTAISMGIGSIFKAKQIVLVASGPKKAEIMASFQNNNLTPQIPASLLKLHPNVTIIMDKEAGKYYL